MAIAYRSNVLKEKFQNRNQEILKHKGQFLVSSGIEERLIRPYSPMRKEFREDLRVLSIGQLIIRKNIPTIIEALNEIPCTHDIFGIGPEYENIMDFIEKGKFKNSHMAGFMEHSEIMRNMVNYDLFVLVSQKETLGLVYLEAMASGLIVIGSKGEGIDGILVDGKNGFLVPPGDVDTLRVKIQSILDMSIDELNSIRRNALQTIKEMGSEKMAISYLDNLNEVLSLKENTLLNEKEE